MESSEKTGHTDEVSENSWNDKIGNVATPSNKQKQPDPKKSTTKRKRRTLTLEEKYKLISAIRDGAKHVEAAKLFDPPLSGSTISTILKEKHKIVRAYEEGSYSDKRKKIKLSRSGFEQFVAVTFHLAVHCCKRKHATLQNSWDMKTLKPVMDSWIDSRKGKGSRDKTSVAKKKA